jgi:hypothetical protein
VIQGISADSGVRRETRGAAKGRQGRAGQGRVGQGRSGRSPPVNIDPGAAVVAGVTLAWRVAPPRPFYTAARFPRNNYLVTIILLADYVNPAMDRILGEA